MPSYVAARAVLMILGLIGWILVIGGFAGVVWTLRSDAGLISYGVSIGLLAAGVMQMAVAQVLRALIDTASNTGAMLALMRRDLNGDDGHAGRRDVFPASHAAAGRREPTMGGAAPGGR